MIESLEQKVDWKEWLPIYGIYQTLNNKYNNKPNIIDDSSSSKFFLNALYQSVCTGSSFLGLIFYLVNR